MHKVSLKCSLLILVLALSAHGQGTVDQNGVYRPTEEEIARNKRLAELWRHPTFVTLRLTSIRRAFPDEAPSTTPSPYSVDQWMHFQLFMTQNSGESLSIGSSGRPYHEYRPHLIRDGDILAYKKEVQEEVAGAEQGRTPKYGSMTSKTLVSGRESQAGLVSLEDWYESPLPAGHYQLIVRKRFVPDGDWVESNPVTFDVIPRKAPASLPEGLSLRLVPDGSKPPRQVQNYRLGYDEGVAVEMINDSNQRIQVIVIDRYYGHRPQLFKDGDLIPYKPEVAKLIESKDKEPRLIEVTPNLFLDSRTTSRVDGFSLKQWYGPLTPGIYRLTDRRRFEIDGPWTKDSGELIFEIIP